MVLFVIAFLIREIIFLTIDEWVLVCYFESVMIEYFLLSLYGRNNYDKTTKIKKRG